MSNFLSRLGARVTNDSAIRPRAVSRFEQPHAPTRVTTLQSADSARPGHAGPIASADAQWGEQPMESQSTRSERGRHDSSLTAAEAVPPDSRRVERSMTNRTILTDSNEQLETSRSRSGETRQILGTTDERDTARRSAQRAHTPIDVQTRHSVDDLPPSAGSGIHPRKMPSRIGDSPQTPRIGTPQLNRDAHESGALDVVHVHIGRIDVRATVQAPERARLRETNAEARGPMSLDRYLATKDRP